MEHGTPEGKFLGGMIGSALGDAIGEIVLYIAGQGMIAAGEEHLLLNVPELRVILDGFPALKYTDDTAMAIGLAESLIATGRLDQQHLGDRFRWNFDCEPWRGYGGGPPAIFLYVKMTHTSYVEAARKVGEVMHGAQGSFGNGATMRIVPLGLFFHDDPGLYAKAEASAVVTNTHPIASDGAAVLARAIAEAVTLRPGRRFPRWRFCRALIQTARTPEIRNKMIMVQDLLKAGTPAPEAARRLGRSVATHESMPFAVYSFLRHPEAFEECLFCAITNGGDCDTLGAMACGISGAYLGIEEIPGEWRERLENRTYLEQLARWLWLRKSGTDDDPEMRTRIAAWTEEARHLDDELLEELVLVEDSEG